jgi:hypothetical protein
MWPGKGVQQLLDGWCSLVGFGGKRWNQAVLNLYASSRLKFWCVRHHHWTTLIQQSLISLSCPHREKKKTKAFDPICN